MGSNVSVKRDVPALLFAMTFPSVMAWLYLVALASGAGQDVKESRAVQVAFGVGKVVQFAFPVLYVWWFDRGRLRPSRPTTTR